MKNKVVWLLLIALGLLCACVLAVFLLQDPKINKTTLSHQNGVFGFNSQSIHQDIASGKTELFSLLPGETDYATAIPDLPPVKFSSSDYLQTIDAFNRYLSEKNLAEQTTGEWVYNNITYSLDCKDSSYGPQEVYLHLLSPSGNSQVRVERFLYIYANRNRVEWREILYDTDEFLPSFDYSKVKISVEEALEISEKHGGRVFRDTENNQCFIVLNIRGDETYWSISYKGNGKVFEIFVDKETGNVIVPEQGEEK